MHLTADEEAFAGRVRSRVVDTAPCHEQLRFDGVVRMSAARFAQPDGPERFHDEAGKAEIRPVGIPYPVSFGRFLRSP